MTVDIEKRSLNVQYPEFSRGEDGSYVFTDPGEFVKTMDQFPELVPVGKLVTEGNVIKIIPDKKSTKNK